MPPFQYDRQRENISRVLSEKKISEARLGASRAGSFCQAARVRFRVRNWDGNFYSFLFFSTLYQSIWDPILCTSGNRHVLHPTDTSWVNKFVRKFMLSGPRSFFSIKILMQETLKSNQKHSLDLVWDFSRMFGVSYMQNKFSGRAWGGGGGLCRFFPKKYNFIKRCRSIAYVKKGIPQFIWVA